MENLPEDQPPEDRSELDSSFDGSESLTETNYSISDALQYLNAKPIYVNDKTIVFINNPEPELPEEMFIDQNGNPVYTFGEKFKQGFEGWKPGQRIRSKFTVHQENGATVLSVSETVCRDNRHSDYFYLYRISEEDSKALLELGVADIDANLYILSSGVAGLSNTFKYSAIIDMLNSKQALYNGDSSKLEDGKSYLMEGKVIEYITDKDRKNARVVLQLENGSSVEVYLFSGYIEIEKSNTLELLELQEPLINDFIQLKTYFGNPNARYGIYNPSTLYAHHMGSSVLLKPSKEREDQYNNRRISFISDLTKLTKLEDPVSIRTEYSQIIRSNVLIDYPYRLALTKDEIRRLNMAIESLLPEEDERPLDFTFDILNTELTNRAYGADLYSMTKSDFVRFCLDIAILKIQPLDLECNSYLSIMRLVLGKDQYEEILQQTVQRFFSLFYVENDADKKSKDNDFLKSLARSTIVSLCHLTTVKNAELYIQLLNGINEHSENEVKAFLNFEILESFRVNIYKILKIIDGTIIKINNKNILKMYIDQLPLLKNLSSNPNLSSFERHILSMSIDNLEAAAQMLKMDNYRIN